MNNLQNIVIEFKENERINRLLSKNLKKFNESIVGSYEAKPFCIYVMDKDELLGGIKGDVFGKLCRVFTVWVDERYRHQGLGSQLFSKLETFVRQQDCQCIQVDTAEFQAKGFYEKIGFIVVATLPDSFMGHTGYILRKNLN